ncbi:beta-L-arabinofuranosidase domain-containing protein [Flavihumibacter sp. UBA7668]|uniref:beta-L-arabinofuranosidase domain-containing protein n=1 Tax=Flavihumibacter sp. UBA7668 TaxID=1946542 RepID=UPI0025C33B77|nr:beta-L-arabinofuranosidase domain-containing protein [Flavihumibacter sp. UBA7668]
MNRSLICLVLVCIGVSALGKKKKAHWHSWWNTDWKYRQWVAIDPAGSTETMRNIPVSVRLTDALFASAYASSNGTDIRAVDSNGQLLPSQLVRFSANDVRLLIRLPQLNKTAGQGFFLYFGSSRLESFSPALVLDNSYWLYTPLAGTLENLAGRPLSISKQGFVVQNGWTAGLITGNSYPWISLSRQYRGFLELISPDADLRTGIMLAARIRPTASTTMSLFSSNGFQVFLEGTKLVVETEKGRLTLPGIRSGIWQSVVIAASATTGQLSASIGGNKPVNQQLIPFSIRTDTMRIGRHMNNGDSTQFDGDLEEMSIQNAYPSDDYLRVIARNLDENAAFLQVQHPETQLGIALPPAPQLVRPANGAQSHKPDGIVLEWLPVPGAIGYEIELYREAQPAKIWKRLSAGNQRSFKITHEMAGLSSLLWTVRAVTENGKSIDGHLAKLDFIQSGSDLPSLNPKRATFSRPEQFTIQLNGYLQSRVHHLQQYMIDFPRRNPGLLRMLRDRPEKDIPDWAGVFPGQYLSSAQLTWRLTKDPELKKNIDQYVLDLLKTQRADGYMGPFTDLNGPLSLWNHYAMVCGLIHYYEDTRFDPALQSAIRIVDLVKKEFGAGGKSIPKTGGASEAISHAVALVYRETKNPEYFRFATYLMHEAWNENGGVAYYQLGVDKKPVADFPVRRWEGIHNIQTLGEMYWVTGNPSYKKAMEHLWHTLRKTERHATGGFSTNEGLLGTPYQHGTIETCCTVAWTLLSTDMLRLTGDSRVADELEWSTLNSALGSIPLDGGCSSYGTQPEGFRRFCELRQGPSDGIELNCCSSNAPRAIGNIANWALLENAGGLVLNYYGPSTLTTNVKGNNTFSIQQETSYPEDGNIRLHISLSQSQKIPVQLRIPQWSINNTILLNGKALPAPMAGTYYTIDRKWKTGDLIELILDFRPRVRAGEEVYSGKVAIYKGPILLAQDMRYSTNQPPAQLDLRSLKIESLPTADDEKQPWLLIMVQDAAGKEWQFCDFSSAGQQGGYYRSWIDAVNIPPAPFYQQEPSTPSLLQWNKSQGAASWTILISDRPDFRNAKKVNGLSKPEYSTVELKPGRYWWTVQAENEHGVQISDNPSREFIKR